MSEIMRKAAQKPLWIAEKAYLWGRSYMRMSPDDVMFAFYPKTGSTWVRIFFYNLLTKKDEGFAFDEINAIMPEFGHPSFFAPWDFKNSPRLIKTHRPYSRLYAKQSAILFAREPRDTMISFLHYANAKKEFNFSGDLDALLKSPEMGLDRYFNFYQSWQGRAKTVVKYEDMRSDPEAVFSKLVAAVGIGASNAEIVAALEASSMERTRIAQERSSEKFRDKFEDGFVFARSGSTGEGRLQFTDAQERLLESKRAQYGFELYRKS